MLLALPMAVSSCDDHEHLDTALHIGHIVCSDGQTLSVEECVRLHKEPVPASKCTKPVKAKIIPMA